MSFIFTHPPEDLKKEKKKSRQCDKTCQRTGYDRYEKCLQYSILAILVMLVITTILTLINKENPTIPSPVLRVVNDLVNDIHTAVPRTLQ